MVKVCKLESPATKLSCKLSGTIAMFAGLIKLAVTSTNKESTKGSLLINTSLVFNN